MDNRVTVYFKPNTKISNFIPLPRFILTADITTSAKQIYGFLLARTMLSQKKENRQNWTDDAGRIFIMYPIQNLATDSSLARSTVSAALSELKQNGLIETKRSGFNQPNRIYVKYIPDAFQKNTNDRISASRTSDNRKPECRNSEPIYTESKQRKNISVNQKIHNFVERDRSPEEWDELEKRLFNV